MTTSPFDVPVDLSGCLDADGPAGGRPISRANGHGLLPDIKTEPPDALPTGPLLGAGAAGPSAAGSGATGIAGRLTTANAAADNAAAAAASAAPSYNVGHERFAPLDLGKRRSDRDPYAEARVLHPLGMNAFSGTMAPPPMKRPRGNESYGDSSGSAGEALRAAACPIVLPPLFDARVAGQVGAAAQRPFIHNDPRVFASGKSELLQGGAQPYVATTTNEGTRPAAAGGGSTVASIAGAAGVVGAAGVSSGGPDAATATASAAAAPTAAAAAAATAAAAAAAAADGSGQEAQRSAVPLAAQLLQLLQRPHLLQPQPQPQEEAAMVAGNDAFCSKQLTATEAAQGWLWITSGLRKGPFSGLAAARKLQQQRCQVEDIPVTLISDEDDDGENGDERNRGSRREWKVHLVKSNFVLGGCMPMLKHLGAQVGDTITFRPAAAHHNKDHHAFFVKVCGADGGGAGVGVGGGGGGQQQQQQHPAVGMDVNAAGRVEAAAPLAVVVVPLAVVVSAAAPQVGLPQLAGEAQQGGMALPATTAVPRGGADVSSGPQGRQQQPAAATALTDLPPPREESQALLWPLQLGRYQQQGQQQRPIGSVAAADAPASGHPLPQLLRREQGAPTGGFVWHQHTTGTNVLPDPDPEQRAGRLGQLKVGRPTPG
ncbi:hypothetical protein PLESTF_000881400 [Pleodorina starrii]|nr:hypothetical protein PLESTF_000881400 [Pleodorina starrii]